MIHPAAKFQFERVVREYARWFAIDENARSLAPGWWWGPAFAVRDVADSLPADWSATLRLENGASYADASRVLIAAMAGQTYQPWPEQFPQRYQSL
jgi:hypothetical protein